MSIPVQVEKEKELAGQEAPDRILNQFKSPNYLTGLMVSALRQYFGSPERLALERSQYLWSEEAAESQIYISESWNLDFSNVGKRPACLVELESQTYPLQTIMPGYIEQFVTKDAMYIFNAPTQGGFLIYCVHETAAEAWNLSYEVKTFLQSFYLFLEDAFCFDRLRVTSLKKPEQLKEYKDYKTSTISVEFQYQERWGISQESLRFQGATFKPNLL